MMDTSAMNELIRRIDLNVPLLDKTKGGFRYNLQAVAKLLRDSGIVMFDGLLFCYTGYGYREISKDDLRRLVVRLLDGHRNASDLTIEPFLSTKFGEVYRRLEALWIVDPFNPEMIWMDKRYRGFLVSFRNGLYNVTTNELLPHTPEAFVIERFDFDYDPTVIDHPIRSDYESIVRGKDYDIFFTALGRTLYSSSTPTFMVVIHGRYGTGKSSLLHTMETLCEEDSFAHLCVRDMSPSSTPSYLKYKVANMDSFSFEGFEGKRGLPGIVSRLVLSEKENSHRKYGPKEKVRNSTPLWFKSESSFRMNYLPSSLKVRTYDIHCKYEQKKDCHDMRFSMMDVKAKQWVANEALRMFRKYGLTPFKYISENSVETFLESIGDDPGIREYLDGGKVGDVYDDYLDCLDESEVPQSKKQFIDYVKSKYNMDTKHKSVRFGDKVTSINVFCKRK